VSYALTDPVILQRGRSRFRSIRGLGAACGPCTIAASSDCEICPDNAGPDFPECDGCVNGVRQSATSAVTQSFVFPIVAGVVTMLTVTWLSAKILRKKAA
jgi:hypothetical protein